MISRAGSVVAWGLAFLLTTLSTACGDGDSGPGVETSAITSTVVIDRRRRLIA